MSGRHARRDPGLRRPRAPARASKDRIARQVMLRTLMLAGPDAQVM